MSYIGTSKIGGMHLGSTKIAKAYLGSDLVFDGQTTPAPPLPYDARVEYLQSSGTQYIDTGITPTATTGMKVKFELVAPIADSFIAGLRNDTGNTRWCVGASTSKYYCGYGTTYGTSWPNPVVGDVTESSVNFLNDGKFIQTTSNQNLSLNAMGFTPEYNIRLFGAAGNSAVLNASYSKWSGKIYSVKISQGSDVVMDLIPVRVGQVGYMYDTISGALYGNAGTGDFTLGNDITT